MREQVLQYVDQYKIIAIVRGADPKQCFAVAEALYAGGIRLMEVTYDQKKPETWQATADTIGALAKEYGDSKAYGNYWSWWDILADVLGIILGTVIRVLIIGRWNWI